MEWVMSVLKIHSMSYNVNIMNLLKMSPNIGHLRCEPKICSARFPVL